MSNFNNKNLQNSQTSPPKIQNDNSNLNNSTDFVGYYSNNFGKTLKNKKLQKLNWQNSHRKNDKKSKFGSKYENKEKKLNSNNYKNSPNNSPNPSQTIIQNQNLEQNSSQEKSFPSFYQKKIPNLSKFQNNIQNIAQNINSQISQIPNLINQNLPNFEPKIPNQINQSLSQKYKQNEDNQNLDQFQNCETANSTKNAHSQDSTTNSNSEHKIRNNLGNLEQNLQNNLQNQSSKFLRYSNFNPDFKNNLSKNNSNHKSFLDNFNYPSFNPLEQKDSFKANYDLKADLKADNYQIIQKNFKNNSTTISRQFAVRHTYRAGAIVWVKYRGENYYVVFRSLMRPSRGIQLPGGRIERMENVADAVTREVYEEIGIQTRILCPLGYLFTENPTDSFSRMEIYYIVRPIFPIDVFRYWQHQDLDEKRQAVEKRQTLECWCVPCSREVDFLSFEQGKAVLMFRDWLSKHKKPELEHTSNF